MPMNDITTIADLVIRYMDEQDLRDIYDNPIPLQDPNYTGPCEAINPPAIELIATTMLDIFANLIATLIDAGSERDAVNENWDLLEELRKELRGWTATED